MRCDCTSTTQLILLNHQGDRSNDLFDRRFFSVRGNLFPKRLCRRVCAFHSCPDTTIYAQWTYTGGSVVIIPDTDETDKSEPENPGTGATVSGSGIGYACAALAAVGAIYVGAKKLAKKDEE